jgi:CBS domain-containing protein
MRHLANQEVPMQVHDVMTTALVTRRPETSSEAAAALLATHGLDLLPVIDEDQRLIGLLTATNLNDAAKGP